MLQLLRCFVVGIGALACGVTLLSLTRGTHWLLRLWDFPRVQIAALAGFAATAYRAVFFRGRPFDWSFLGATLLCFGWQTRKIFPFTPISPVQVKRNPRSCPERSFRLLISNVLMENRQHHRLLELIDDCQPDVILVVETDTAWAEALRPLAEAYPHRAGRVQENYYGMLLFSKLKLINPRLEYLIQGDVPSIHTELELPSGERVWLHGLHPRPPEPIRDQNSTPRDAELVVVGRAIREAGPRPTIVAGDLNDVAWSPTSELFLKLSGLLDPRVGRGFSNSFHADHWLVRYPLDHVFHSNDFELVEIHRLRHIGSDHFPVLIELCYQPAAKAEQPKPEADAGDQEMADDKLREQAKEERGGAA